MFSLQVLWSCTFVGLVSPLVPVISITYLCCDTMSQRSRCTKFDKSVASTWDRPQGTACTIPTANIQEVGDGRKQQDLVGLQRTSNSNHIASQGLGEVVYSYQGPSCLVPHGSMLSMRLCLICYVHRLWLSWSLIIRSCMSLNNISTREKGPKGHTVTGDNMGFLAGYCSQ